MRNILAHRQARVSRTDARHEPSSITTILIPLLIFALSSASAFSPASTLARASTSSIASDDTSLAGTTFASSCSADKDAKLTVDIVAIPRH